jgi:HK97 family phage portal protein
MKTTKLAKRPGPIRTALLEWLGRPFGLTDTAAWAELVGMSGAPEGIKVNAQTMMTLSAVWACTRLISETISTLPLSMYERTSTGKAVATQHPLHFVIHDQPNADSTAAVFWEAMIAAMLNRGCGRAEKLMLGDRLVGLRFLAPSRLFVGRDSRGLKEYRYTEKDGRQRVIPRDRVWTVPGFTLNGEDGVSVVAYGARVFGAALAADTAASSTFSKGLMPTTYFKYPKVLGKEQREDTRAAIKVISGAVNAGDPAVLEADMDVGTIGINPADAQMLESRGFSVEEICRWFRVPPFMVGHSEKSTSWGTGIEQQMIGFLTFTLGPWLRRIEQAIKKDLLTPADRARFYAKFNVEGLLRADSAARAAFYVAMRNNGILTADEIRELEERAPMGGNAAVLTVQGAMVPLDSIGQTTADQQARAALRAFLGIEDQPERKD